MILSKNSDLLALCGLVILFPFATEALKPTAETFTSRHGPLLINILTVSSDKKTEMVINYHLNDSDFVNNFRIDRLANYPQQQHILNEASISDIQRAIDKEIPESGIKIDYIVYDIEEWDKTPIEEQENPVDSINKAADIVHAAGYGFGISPSRQLLASGLDKMDWQKTELLIIQTQKLVGTEDFKDTTHNISNTVRSENPRCMLMVQVNPSLNTTDKMVNAINSVRDVIDGVSIIWNKSEASMLNELLTSLKR
jgi:hypothetical protein